MFEPSSVSDGEADDDPILSGLSPIQRQAVLHPKGPLLVLAGAGSGKTRVLTRRVAHLILRREVSPDRVLAVTFTNKAAGEMRERVEHLLGFEASGLWIGTFHSICLRLLRRHGERLGFHGPITVFDDDDQSSLLKEILKSEGADEDAPKVRELKNIISMAKNKLWDPEALLEHWPSPHAGRFAKLYAEYQRKLRAQDGADFDDLLCLAVRLLEEHPEIGDAYARKFEQILVDEYQDTNHVQFRFVRRLAEGHGNVLVVGDDDQSIYGWRGADIANILEFERHFSGARVLQMTQNYRSTQRILAVAQAVVEKNQGRHDKKIWTENEAGEPVILSIARDEEEEARLVIGRIRDGVREGRWKPGEVAILYRMHAQSRPLEEACLHIGVPYVIVGGVAFYQRREVKDLLAYLRLTINPRDEVSFRRVIAAPRRGIGDTGIDRIVQAAARLGGDLVAALEQLDASAGLREAARKKAVELGRMLRELSGERIAGPEKLLQRIVDRTDYVLWLKESGDGDWEDRKANVQELLEGAGRYHEARGEDSVESYLDQVALYSNLDKHEGTMDRIALMTVHNAKGLEFPSVFLTGLEEGIFPHASSYDSQSEMEEERRLFYVAATRAMKSLSLSASLARRRMNWSGLGGLSRFLGEIPSEHLVTRSLAGYGMGPSPGAGGFSSQRPGRISDMGALDPLFDADVVLDAVADVPTLRREPSAVSEWKGRIVRHAVFGQGTVLDGDGQGPEARLTILFAGKGPKKIMARFVTPLG